MQFKLIQKQEELFRAWKGRLSQPNVYLLYKTRVTVSISVQAVFSFKARWSSYFVNNWLLQFRIAITSKAYNF